MSTFCRWQCHSVSRRSSCRPNRCCVARPRDRPSRTFCLEPALEGHLRAGNFRRILFFLFLKSNDWFHGEPSHDPVNVQRVIFCTGGIFNFYALVIILASFRVYFSNLTISIRNERRAICLGYFKHFNSSIFENNHPDKKFAVAPSRPRWSAARTTWKVGTKSTRNSRSVQTK